MSEFWLLMDSAPKDGTEIVVRDDSGVSLVAWHPANKSEPDYPADNDENGWCLRAKGKWNLYDGFALQFVEPKEWKWI